MESRAQRRQAGGCRDERRRRRLVLAVVARESALRGYALTRRTGFLESYDEATGDLAAAADRARRHAGPATPSGVRRSTSRSGSRKRWGSKRERLDHRCPRRSADPDRYGAESEAPCVTRIRLHNEELRRTVIERATRTLVTCTPSSAESCSSSCCSALAFAARRELLIVHVIRRADDARRTARARRTTRAQREFSRDAAGDGERDRGARARQTPSRALASARSEVRRPEPQQQPEPARGGHTPRTCGPRSAREAGRLVAVNSCLAVRLGRTHVQLVGRPSRC